MHTEEARNTAKEEGSKINDARDVVVRRAERENTEGTRADIFAREEAFEGDVMGGKQAKARIWFRPYTVNETSPMAGRQAQTDMTYYKHNNRGPLRAMHDTLTGNEDTIVGLKRSDTIQAYLDNDDHILLEKFQRLAHVRSALNWSKTAMLVTDYFALSNC
ncbi:hypothetical protein M436DRAFT_67770 [Aureobasidium namibiae CBS 147.97]|uniref:Uncharacterized protein n=1 Tax=Aureobasidium namibiae CBS 147.97 TaxID=1043004 RepID=A0A074W7K1_9PEZI